MDRGSLCSLPLLLLLLLLLLYLHLLSHSLRMESRSDTGGNRVEIQESASLQLGSDVTKFRVAAAEVGRHFVSSSEQRDSRAGISHIAQQGDIFFSAVLLLFFFLPFSPTGEILHCDCGTIAKLILSLGANWNFWPLFHRDVAV